MIVEEYMKGLGYKKEEINKIINTYPLYNLKEETLYIKINEVYNYLINLGYVKDEVIKMTKLLPTLFSLSNEIIENKINYLISLGYTKEEIIKMTKLLPALFSLSNENIEGKINYLISLEYSKEEVIKMTKLLPALFSYSKETIKEKVEFLRSIELDFIIINDTKQLMQSIDLTYARYMYLKDKDIMIDQNNYRKLFYDAKQFEKKYGISKKKLLERYNYRNDNKRILTK